MWDIVLVLVKTYKLKAAGKSQRLRVRRLGVAPLGGPRPGLS